jgi:hypothetical protein
VRLSILRNEAPLHTFASQLKEISHA